MAFSLAFNLLTSAFHELPQGRKVDPNAPADASGLKLRTTHVSPKRGMGKTGIPLCLRVTDPLLLYWLLKQRSSLLFVVFLSVSEMIR